MRWRQRSDEGVAPYARPAGFAHKKELTLKKSIYLHIGQDFMIKKHGVVGIFDLDNASGAGTKAFFRRAQREGLVVDASDDIPRSFTVCTTAAGDAVYLSQLSTAALARRWNGE